MFLRRLFQAMLIFVSFILLILLIASLFNSDMPTLVFLILLALCILGIAKLEKLHKNSTSSVDTAKIKAKTSHNVSNVPNVSNISKPVMAEKLIDTYSKVAGVTFPNDEGEDIQEILPKLRYNTKLNLVREPNNSYDKNAIKIFAKGNHIGYVKSHLAEEVAPLLDNGHTYEATISEITGGAYEKNFGCNYKITVFDKSF